LPHGIRKAVGDKHDHGGHDANHCSQHPIGRRDRQPDGSGDPNCGCGFDPFDVKTALEDGFTSRFAQNRTLPGFRMVLAFQRGSERGYCNKDCQQLPC